MSNPYEAYGCANRDEYLQRVADDNGVDINTVLTVADMLGPSEDFDGLLVCIYEEG